MAALARPLWGSASQGAPLVGRGASPPPPKWSHSPVGVQGQAGGGLGWCGGPPCTPTPPEQRFWGPPIGAVRATFVMLIRYRPFWRAPSKEKLFSYMKLRGLRRQDVAAPHGR